MASVNICICHYNYSVVAHLVIVERVSDSSAKGNNRSLSTLSNLMILSRCARSVFKIFPPKGSIAGLCLSRPYFALPPAE